MASEISLYALLVIQPLPGCAMLSARALLDAELFWLLRQAHSVVAYALMAVIAAHVSAVVLHTVTLRDGMLSRMAFALRVSGGGETKGG